MRGSSWVTDERAALAGETLPVGRFQPSLHLNVGDCYRRIGDLDRAREHLEAGLAAVGSREDDGYGRFVRAGLDRLAGRLRIDGEGASAGRAGRGVRGSRRRRHTGRAGEALGAVS